MTTEPSWAWIEISSKQQHEICDVVSQAVRNKGTLAMGMVMGQMSEGEIVISPRHGSHC